MRNQFQLLVIFAASWTSTNPFQWSGESADNSVQHVCQGDDLHLLWDFNATGNSIVTSIQWFFRGSSEEVVAMKSHGHFLPMATYYDRVRLVPGAGLVISHVGLADKGNYSVEVLGTGDSFATGKQRRSLTVVIAAKLTSCVDSRSSNPVSGVVTIYPDNVTPVEVYCDQDTDGGGWAVFQRRQDGSVDFYRNWVDYQNQFGDLNGEFWIGLDALHTLTSSQPQELRVDLTKWDLTRVSASYSGFTISDGNDNYRLNYTRFLGGTAGDSLSFHREMQFSTKDADHDTWDSGRCAQEARGAWWYYSCHQSNLNGQYQTSSSAPLDEGLIWNSAGGYTYSMKATEMKLRPS